jgi:hypothetical protein
MNHARSDAYCDDFPVNRGKFRWRHEKPRYVASGHAARGS